MKAAKRACTAWALVLAAYVSGLVVIPIADATPAVSSMSASIYQRLNPTTLASITTPWMSEATGAAKYGFTVDNGAPFKAALVAASDLSGVKRLYNSKTSDFAWALVGSSTLTSLLSQGYVDQGVNFFASPVAVDSQTQVVNSYLKGTKRRLAVAGDGAKLVASGWALEYAAFYVPSSTTTPPPPPPPPTPSPTQGTAGSLPVGSATYSAPSDALYVAPSGSDSAAGSVTAPLRTVAAAMALAPSGRTIILRAGIYHESLSVDGKQVIIQNYPGEAAWFDGSVGVTGWAVSGTAWRHDGWTQRFDHSPTYSQGAPDSNVANWQFVNPQTYPMAAHPDQVFLNGAALRQVQTRAQVTAGTFFLDENASALYVGSDPSGKTVEASTLIKAGTIRGANTVIRGVGFRRFSPSVFHMGALTIEAPGVKLENVVIEDSATTGLSVMRENAVLTHVTIVRSGMLGVHGSYADNVSFIGVLSTQNNVEHFNIAPVSGGVKLGKSRGITVRDSSFAGNLGSGFWEDLSCYNTTIVNSSFTDNAGSGLFLEISAKAVVADSFFARNAQNGAKINNTTGVQMWNNTFVAEVRPVWLAQDSRRNTNPNDPAVDKRISWPDPEMPWTLGPLTFANNVVSQSSSNSLIDVEDYSNKSSAEQMNITLSGNVYYRTSPTSPAWLIIWSRGSQSPYVFTSVSQFRATTRQEATGQEFSGAPIVDASGGLIPAVSSMESSIAQPLPSSIAAILGRVTGTRHLGIW